MSQQRKTQLSYTEADLQLALFDIRSQRVQSIRQAAAIYNVPEQTLRHRRAGKRFRRDCEANSKRLTKLEEETIVRRVLKESDRGFAPTKADVRDMADRLLQERGSKPVGKNWVDNFVKRTPELRKRWSRPYDHQRAACEDPAAIQRWFDQVKTTKEKWGILDDDIYNFDETGFMMGKLLSQMVITGWDCSGKKKRVQPGNREWVTVIQGVGASGRRIPPFVIFAGKVLISTWFKDLPRDWVLTVSINGWTNNQLALAWLEHFDAHTKASTIGGYRLLIIDGHESHCSIEFRDRCQEKNIIYLCMPPHSSHLLQPLDIACFSPLKRAYSDEISALARNRITSISKEAFLPGFKAAYNKAISEENIQAGFRGAGLVPYDPEVVILKLDVRLRTPTPPQRDNVAWEAQTPRNAKEVEAQSTLIRNRIKIHRGSPASSLDEQVRQLSKGAQQIAHNMVLLQEEQARMRSAIEELTKRRTRKRRYVQTEETLTVGEVSDLIAATVQDGRDDGAGPSKRVRVGRRCGTCGETGHNARTCTVEIEDANDSDSSVE
jgi:hypothetical protein